MSVPDSPEERMARFLDDTGLPIALDDPLVSALVSYHALLMAARVHEKFKREVAEKFAVLTEPQQQTYIGACELIDAAERGDPS